MCILVLSKFSSLNFYLFFIVDFLLILQVTEIWFDHLNNLVDQRIQEPPPPSGIGPAQIASEKVEFDHLGKFV